MFRSIRWKLQLWHALLLLLVVCVFGGIVYNGLRQARMRSVNAELEALAQVLGGRLKPGRPGPPPWMRQGPETRPVMANRNDPEPPPPPQWDGPRLGGPPDGEGPRWDGPRRGGPPPGDEPPFRDGGRRGGFRGGPPELDPARFDDFQRRLEIPEDVLRRFEGDEEANAPYFIIWRTNGQVLRAMHEVADITSPGPQQWDAPPLPPQFHEHGHYREVVVPGGFGTRVLVGRSILKEQHELRQLLWLLAITGLGVTIIGLVGGWLLSARAIRPIQTITATAQTISASNLSRRINLTEMESELGSLAAVLNAMFSRLEGAFDRQVRFTADASHELRTPLSIIYSHAELALGRQRSADEYRETIETCFRAAKRMKSLVESLLVLARADAGKLEIKQEQFDLKQTIEDCGSLVEHLAEAKKVQVKLDLEPVAVSGDSFRIAQVVTNLLTNAINYNREGGSVTVTARNDGPAAVVTVTDTGVGIAEADQQHLFERFYRVDKARSRELGGSGLGLAICKSIIEAHGGTISFTSKIDEGTSFTVKLPRQK